MERFDYLPSLSAGLGLASLLLLASPVQAQKIYVCKDASGRTLTSDRPLPECANRAMKELNSTGMTKREIPAPLTAEQVRQKKEADAKKTQEEKNAAEQRKRDETLLATYKSEQQIEAERQRAVTQLRNNINIALTAKGVAEQRYKTIQGEMTILKEKGGSVPPNLRERAAEAEKAVQLEAHNAESMEAELGKTKARYDDIMQRYRAAVGNTGNTGNTGKIEASAAQASTSGKK